MTDLMPDSPANPLAITVESTGDSITLFVSGQVDIENCQQLADALESATEGQLHAHVDLTEVDYMDSSGLRALLVARAAAEKTGERSTSRRHRTSSRAFWTSPAWPNSSRRQCEAKLRAAQTGRKTIASAAIGISPGPASGGSTSSSRRGHRHSS